MNTKDSNKQENEEEQKVVSIHPDYIYPNPENPRLIFYDETLDVLRASIKKYGILVPLTVYQPKKSIEKYVILDGERRWRCSQKLNLKQVPVNVIAAPNRQQNILLMFNIHLTRDKWELVPTALKIEALIRLLSKNITLKEIASLTGMTLIRVNNCKRILRFDKKYLDLTLVKDPKRRIRGEFFSQLEEALEKLSKEDFKQIGLTRNKVVDIMIKKYQNKTFTNLITEFRTLRKVITSTEKGITKKDINRQLSTYLKSEPVIDKKTGKIKSKAMSISEVYEKTSFNVYAEEQIIKASEKLNDVLYKFNIAQVQDKQKVRKILKKLKLIIEDILEV